MPIFNSGTANVANITIAPGATLPALTISGGTFNVCGNWTNSATTGHFAHTNGTVNFIGTVPQTISGLNVFDHVTVNNGGNGVTLGSATQIKGLLNLQNGNLVSNGNLTLISTAAQTAMVVNNGAFVVTGDATVQRHITPYGIRPVGLGYTYVSTPVASATVSAQLGDDVALVFNPAYKFNCWLYPAPYSSAPFPNLYLYNETLVATGVDAACMSENTDKFETAWQSAAGGTLFFPGFGYCLNVAGNTTLDASGTLNNGVINVAVSKTDATAVNSGWNLLGNPYPAPIDWDLVYNANSGFINGGISRRIATGTYSGTWAYYLANVPASGTNGATNEVAAMQGFLMRATANGNLQFNNSMRATSYTNPNFFRTESHFDLLRLSLHNGTAADEMTVYFGGKTTPNFENEGDVEKMQFNSLPAPNLYTQTGSKPLSINGLGTLSESVIVPLTFIAAKEGKQTFKLTHKDGFAGYTVYLEDTEAKTLHKIAESEYVFTSAKGKNETRFRLRFAQEEKNDAEISIGLYPNPAENTVQIQFSKATTANIALVDILGREILSTTSEGQSVMLDIKHLPAGMYVVEINMPEGKQSLKMIKE
jgi:hypothetical protein